MMRDRAAAARGVAKRPRVHMVGHQDICMDETAVFPGRVAQTSHVTPPIIVCVEHRLPVIASLNDVLGHPGQDKSEPSRYLNS